MIPIATNERKLVKIFRDKNPQGSGLVWCLKWNDGKEEYTIDAASSVGRFRLVDEMRMRQDYLDDKLTARYRKLETQRGFIRITA